MNSFILSAEVPVKITHPDKILWPEHGYTKQDLLTYLVQAGPFLLPYLKRKPVTLVRCPGGIDQETFYQRHLQTGTPSHISRFENPESNHLIRIETMADLLWYANGCAIEYHVGFQDVSCQRPSTLTFDLDPTDADFEKVRKVALRIHDLLDKYCLQHFVKTSGATGVQIFVPIDGSMAYEETSVIATAIAAAIAKDLPDVVTLERLVKNRGRKVYIDTPQHGKTRTLISAYSPRAATHGTVSAPIMWKELALGCEPQDFTLVSMPSRLGRLGDLFASAGERDNTRILRSLLSSLAPKK